MEVVDMLNEIYKNFDHILDHHDVYKVIRTWEQGTEMTRWNDCSEGRLEKITATNPVRKAKENPIMTFSQRL